MKRLAVFASGSGTNTENIISYFKQSKEAEVILVLSNKAEAYVLERAKSLGVSGMVFDRTAFYENTIVFDRLIREKIDMIVLAGFLWLVPQNILQAFPNRIINIHPALLPSYGGKGMYGNRVHQAVIDNGEKESGITIHIVDAEYDKGRILLQAYCEVFKTDTPDSLAERIHDLEYTYFPLVIEKHLGQI